MVSRQELPRRVQHALLSLTIASCIVVAVVLVLRGSVTAAPPIDGNPVSVGDAESVGIGSVGLVRDVAAVDLDRDGRADVAYGAASSLVIQRNVGITDTEWAQTVTVGYTDDDIQDVHAVDLDRDGQADLVSVVDHAISLWKNPGLPFTATWTTSHTLPGSVISLTTVASGDLDRDGTPDLVSGGEDGTIRLWSNPLTGTQLFTTSWAVSATISSPSTAIHHLVIAYIDRDGWLDIVVAGGGGGLGTVRVWQNPGLPFTTSWEVSSTLSIADAAYAVDVGDLDNDGAPDILVGREGGQVVAWQNPLTGTQTFATSWTISSTVGDVGLPVHGLSIMDADHDGWLDVVAAGSGAPSTLVVWHSTADPFGGGWDGVTLGAPSDWVLSLAVADSDRDGDADIVAAGGNTLAETGGLDMWENLLIRSSARFETPDVSDSVANAWSGSRLRTMELHDMDRDGLQDAVLVTLDGSLILLRNDGTPFDSASWPTVTIGYSFGFFALAVGDLDGDGWPDIATSTTLTGTGGLVHVWQNDGTPFDGLWISQTVATLARQVMDLELGDVSRQGRLEIVAATGITMTFEDPEGNQDVPASDDNAIWLLGPEGSDPFSSSWISSTVCTTTYSANDVALGDLDRDGWIDVVYGTDHAPLGTTTWPTTSGFYDGPAYQVRACRSLGDPYSDAGWETYDVGRDNTLAANQYLPYSFWGAHVWSVAVGDLDRDGDLDVVSGGGWEGDYQVVVYENDGTPFGSEPWSLTGIGYGSRTDGGDPYCPGPGVYPQDCPWLEAGITAVGVGDLNRDGWLDVLSGFSGRVSVLPVWLNTGMPFGEVPTDTHWIRQDLDYDPIRAVYRVEATDLNVDGRPDVAAGLYVTPGLSAPLRVWQNLGGIARHDSLVDYGTNSIEDGASYGRITFSVTNNGRIDDNEIELARLEIRFVDAGDIAMTNEGAGSLFQSVQVYRDANDDGLWQLTDTPVVTVATFSLDDGYQDLVFPTSDSEGWIAPSQVLTYFVVLNMQPTASQAHPASFRLYYYPHTRMLSRDPHTQATVSMEEGAWTDTPSTFPVPAPPFSVTVASDPATIEASGTSTSTITATVTTAYDYPVLDGTVITFATSAGTLPSAPYTTTTVHGIVTAVLTSSMDKVTAVVTATASEAVSGTAQVEFVGVRASLRINDASGAGGSEVDIHTMTLDDDYTVYVAAYDGDGMFIENPTDVTWGGTGVVAGNLSPTSGTSMTVFSPSITGTGTITVSDGSYADGTGEITVTDTPIVGLSATSDSPTPLGATTTLTASVSAGSNVIYTWSFGDGRMGSGVTTTHEYEVVGTYTATVTATNGISQEMATTVVYVGLGDPDYILIRDAPAGAGEEVGSRSLVVGQELVLYAAVYDEMGNYLSDQAVLWSVTGNLDAVPSGPSPSLLFVPSTGNTSGTIEADDQGGHTDTTGTITVMLYRVFLPMVMRQ